MSSPITLPAALARVPKLKTPFSRLPRKQRIKLVAKDVLARLGADQLIPIRGVLVQTSDDLDSGVELQDRLTQGLTCEVCALGAAAAGIAFYEDRMKMGDQTVFSWQPRRIALWLGDTEDSVEPRLVRLFGRRQMALIEYAFEGRSMAERTDILTVAETEAAHTFSAFFGSHDRLRAIYTQLAKTGVFDPRKGLKRS